MNISEIYKVAGLQGAIIPFEIIGSLLIYTIVNISVILSSAADSGVITSYIVFLTVLTVLRNSVLQLLLGISWDFIP